MKKLSLFGVVLFAFQVMVLAQTNYEVSVGSGIWWENGNPEFIEKPYSSLLSAGFFAKRNFKDKSLGLKTGVEYSYLFASYDNQFDGMDGVWAPKDGNKFDDIFKNYGARQHNISIPLLLYWDRYNVQPFFGLNYNYLATGRQTSTNGAKYFSDSHNFGLNLGVDFKISELFSINMEYKHNLTSDFSQSKSTVGGDGSSGLGSNYNLTNAQAKLSLVYCFRKKSTVYNR